MRRKYYLIFYTLFQSVKIIILLLLFITSEGVYIKSTVDNERGRGKVHLRRIQ